MTLATNALTTFGVVGGREQLANKIYNISPKDTPFMNRIGRMKAEQTYVEWQIESLANVNGSNAQLEGDVVSPSAQTQPTRISNTCQISYKDVSISGTAEVTNKAGRVSEMARLLAKKTLELKRDQETILTNNQAPVPAAHPSNPTGGSASTTVARKLRPYEGWITTNDDRGSGGSDGTSTAAATDASGANQRAFTETLMQNVMQLCWTAGGSPDTMLVGGFNKRVFSGFTGNSQRIDEGEDKKLTAALDVFVSDFGTLRAVASRFSRAQSALIFDSEYWALATLRGYKTKDLASSGDYEWAMITTEYTLIAKNEASSGIVADLTSS